tara:strand:- start:2117 stop:2275 length:159 start_codon:yes stop_codon:yes gene_type:complete
MINKLIPQVVEIPFCYIINENGTYTIDVDIMHEALDQQIYEISKNKLIKNEN